MNLKRLSRSMALVCAFAALLLSGCAHDAPSRYEHGKAYRRLFTAQVANTSAPKDPTPVDGMPGFVSEGIFRERYLKEIVESEDEEESGGKEEGDEEGE